MQSERTVWDGDQVLWEVRVAEREFQENDAPQGPRAGRVGYTHGPAIDAPLSFVRAGLDADPPHIVVMHLRWRAMSDRRPFRRRKYAPTSAVAVKQSPLRGQTP